ncbi:zinc-dependent alcohol dehydrogenase family protein [Streptomyces sp. NBC_00151]|jgi:NADPH:quinone reductase-like Zn-dependent oxidoreductase|uniref:zinc-dependent alcohol dehydrogenase family protein n=1 Tax=Streptomyces sp. NBC_00151 TaxID=2975669 RepID=UPI002DD7B838|nr:zinc-dependent alcohol dehydrogenase family protein [Streptomyces sp. NBC_00151]WRZ37449.1 zinc-dependent alcohol dehydrogenase family protein [Streptomyces sp. NBC_00151]
MAKQVVFDEIGGPEVLRIEQVELGEPGPGEVLLRVDALGLNRAEALFRSGGYYYQPNLPGSRLGYEAAGEVVALGAGVTDFAVGDQVLTTITSEMSANGTYGDALRLPAGDLIHRPGGTDPVTGAALWLSYSTAYGALVEKGELRPGDTVLITAASSSVGVAAIQTARHLGAIPIAVTRSAAKRERLEQLGAAHVIALDEGDLLKQVAEITDGRGAQIVFDAVSGPGLADIAQAVAPGGLLIVYGWLDPRPAPLPLNWTLRILGYGNLQVTGDPAVRRRVWHFLDAGLRAGTVAPVIDRTFDLEEIAEAHRHLESNSQIGKIVVTVDH